MLEVSYVENGQSQFKEPEMARALSHRLATSVTIMRLFIGAESCVDWSKRLRDTLLFS